MNISMPQLLQIIGAAHIEIAMLREEIDQLKRQLAEEQAKKVKKPKDE